MKRKICPCGKKSVPGLIASVSLCQEHYNGLMFAPNDSKEHKECALMLAYSQQGISVAPNDITLKGGAK